MITSFKRFFIIAFICFVAQPTWAAKSFCASYLSTGSTDAKTKEQQEEDALQAEIIAKEHQIREVAREFEKILGPYQDPFAFAVNTAQADKLFQSMLTQVKDGRKTHSPLAIMDINRKKSYVEKTQINWKLLNWLEDDAKKLLQKTAATQVPQLTLQSELYALRIALEYLNRYKIPEVVVDRDGEEQEKDEKKKDKKPKEQKEKKEKKEKKPKKDAKKEYPKLPKEYKPHTKNTEKSQGEGEGENPVRVAETTVKTPYWAYSYFTNVKRGVEHPFREGLLTVKPNTPPSGKRTTEMMKVSTFGELDVDLFLPPLYRPLQPLDPRGKIYRTETGGYKLKLSQPIDDLEIPLVNDAGINLNPFEKQMLTESVGIKLEEWPALIRAGIINKYSADLSQKDPLRVAQAIADFISTEYLYSVGERPETDPIDALNSGKNGEKGAFQCDMAAFAMIGLLRDVYKIPSRAVGGFRGKSFRGGADKKSYLMIPAEGHAWVEVFHNGKWHMFDPTPVNKDKKTKEEGDESEYSDIPLENTQKSDDENDNDTESQNPSESSNESESKLSEIQKRMKEEAEKRAKESKEQRDKKDKEKKEDNAKEENKDGDPSEAMTKEDLANQLELGSVDMGPNKDGMNPLIARAMRIMLKMAINPAKNGFNIQNRLNQIAKLTKTFGSPDLRALYQDAVSAHMSDHPALIEWIEKLSYMMPKQEINKSHQDIHKIILALETYSRLLDATTKKRDATPIPTKLLSTLKEVKKIIEGFAHADTQDIGLVEDLMKDLPDIPRQVMRKDYDFTGVGPNAPTKKIAADLRAGKLNDFRLLAHLSPHADFILNSTPRPENLEVRTWTRDYGIPRGRDILPFQRFSDIGRTMLGQPGKSLEENIKEGTAFIRARRQRIHVPMSRGIEEAERITIVLYDTSGSMADKPGRFQAGLIGAFVSKALSDVSPSGRHRHKVVIVPFDDTPGNPRKITNTQEAIEVIRNYQKEMANTGKGTNIQLALMQAMALIAQAEKEQGNPLAAANIVLMTDGQADVNVPELVEARKAIDAETPLQVMFAAINQTNKELRDFAESSAGKWATGGFYREFTSEDISDVLQESDTLDTKKKHFYSDRKGSEIPQRAYKLLNQAAELARDFTTQISQGNQYTPARNHLMHFNGKRWNKKEKEERQLGLYLIKVRQFLDRYEFKDQALREQIVDDILFHFQILTGVDLNELSNEEYSHLDWLISNAAGIVRKEN